ncbi:hypothetical protein [Microbaculum marinum]|uniref:Uncharacterized protein n=1 Tax=Microbaculum marinum TaxID=1764581 RepID=A0AAW9RTU6_9HYPH
MSRSTAIDLAALRRRARAAVLAAAVAAVAVTVGGLAGSPAQAQDSAAASNEVSGTCKTFRTAFATGANTIWTTTPSYTPVEDATVSFRMKRRGCVIVRFSATASSVLEGNLLMRAVFDGKKLMAPGVILLTSNDDLFYGTHSMEFVLTNVKPGKHTVSIEWNPNDPNKAVSLGPRMTSVWYSK